MEAKKIYTNQSWLYRFEYETKRVQKLDIRPLIKEYSMDQPE